KSRDKNVPSTVFHQYSSPNRDWHGDDAVTPLLLASNAAVPRSGPLFCNRHVVSFHSRRVSCEMRAALARAELVDPGLIDLVPEPRSIGWRQHSVCIEHQ